MIYLAAAGRKLHYALFQIWSAFHWLVGHARRLRRYVRKSWAGADPLCDSRMQAVYVHYDKKGMIHNYVLKQLEALLEAGFRTTFVSNSPQFPEKNVAELAPFCRQILWRQNVGYDFGAYKDGISAIGALDRVERLLLMNDSVYGPFCPLDKVLGAIDATNTDLWGITDSWQHHYHIQSYFILFLPNAIQSPTFRRFWRHLPYVNWKSWVSHKSELKLTQVFTQRKLRAKVLVPYWDVAMLVLKKLEDLPSDLPAVHRDYLDRIHRLLVQGTPMNAPHVFWETLLTDFSCPFLKREVITANPVKVPFIWRWEEVVTRVSNYDPDLIRQHLQAL
jgi:hypothetical protein